MFENGLNVRDRAADFHLDYQLKIIAHLKMASIDALYIIVSLNAKRPDICDFPAETAKLFVVLLQQFYDKAEIDVILYHMPDSRFQG